jgi:large subunit ribosomal protein L5
MSTPTTETLKAEHAASPPERTLPRLQQRYREEIAPALRDEFTISNVMQIPNLV